VFARREKRIAREIKEFGYIKTIGWFVITDEQNEKLNQFSRNAKMFAIFMMFDIHDNPDATYWSSSAAEYNNPFGYMMSICRNFTAAQEQQLLKFFAKLDQKNTKSAPRKTKKKKTYQEYESHIQPNVMNVFGS
jgi:hypothetical protein